jgi:predicted nuclease of predicted toxin-antitoxin system
MALLFADEDFPFAVVEELRRLGHDALTVRDVGLANIRTPDEDVLAVAISQGRAVLTRNRWHFGRLHRLVRPHAGIIACTHDLDFLGQASRIHSLLAVQPVLVNQLLRVTRPP